MRRLDVPVYVGVMKSTLNQEEPLLQVSDQPFSPPAFDDYLWFRAEVAVRIQPAIRETEISSQVEEVSEPPPKSV
jgi:hypothetical protein